MEARLGLLTCLIRYGSTLTKIELAFDHVPRSSLRSDRPHRALDVRDGRNALALSGAKLQLNLDDEAIKVLVMLAEPPFRRSVRRLLPRLKRLGQRNPLLAGRVWIYETPEPPTPGFFPLPRSCPDRIPFDPVLTTM
jgi:hypothetical protein